VTLSLAVFEAEMRV